MLREVAMKFVPKKKDWNPCEIEIEKRFQSIDFFKNFTAVR